jgi:hypothetical protein
VKAGSRPRPRVRCHCGQKTLPTFTVSDDQRTAWFRCRACGHQGPTAAWDGSVSAVHAAAVAWDDDNARIRRGVGLPVRPVPTYGVVKQQEGPMPFFSSRYA